MNSPRNVAILIFDDVEILDFCGPYEVFGVTGEEEQPKPFNVFTIAEAKKPVLARNQLSVNPSYSLTDCPPINILLIPGGLGTRKQMHNPWLLDWIRTQAESVELLLSVCTGALLLAKAGLLDGLAATTHHCAFELLQEIAPKTEIRQGDRFVDNGKIILSAGISAGIDMSLYVVAQLLGEETAIATAREMEYNWRPSPHID